MKNKINFKLTLLLLFVMGLSSFNPINAQKKQFHTDKPFTQEYSIKYDFDNARVELKEVVSDRNGYIQILSSHGLLRTRAGQHLFPGSLVKDINYKPTADKGITSVLRYKDQLVYIDDEAVLSNAWAGKLFSKHSLKDAKVFAGDDDFSFLISDGTELHLIKNSKTLWKGETGDKVVDIKYDAANTQYWVLGEKSINVCDPLNMKVEKVIANSDVTAMAVVGDKLYVGTNDGYFTLDTKTKKQVGSINKKLPWTEITTVAEIDGNVWFGSKRGAFMLNKEGKFDYYASKRWIPSDLVNDIAKGPENSILILTDKGLGKICRKEMTLYDKAMYYDKQVRDRHIRNGFNAGIVGMVDGDVTSGYMRTSDNDGLWTTMYLAGEVFRYSVTKSEEALQNVRESLDALERLYTINHIPGFPSRSFERRGYKYSEYKWKRAEDPEWDWKSTTSSDEAIGHIFVFAAIAELVDVPELQNTSIMLIDTLMSHIVENDFYMIDWNGKPTEWARWHPDYVNARPKMVGDRKINSSNIIGMLQTAYHFTKKEKYKEAAYYLMDEHGYLENLMRPMNDIGIAPEDSDELSKELSDSWNHSDDEMYYCGYWGLYRYAFTNELKAKYKEIIIDHFEYEREEKEGLWNIMTALVGAKEIDMPEAAWYLQKYPLDLVDWTIVNSERKDIELLDWNFRKQTIKEVLPANELRVSRHNANRFDLDSYGRGTQEFSAGDIWLLPYWIGRYLNVIGAPEKK